MPQAAGSIVTYPARAAFVWYLGMIIGGTSLLILPFSHAASEKPIGVLDAVFTATSATCVTGLIVRDTPNDFSLAGQAIILLLIQLGGIGIMTVTTFIVFQMRARGSLRERAVIAATLGADQRSDLRGVLRQVLLFTLLAESIGFALLAFRNMYDVLFVTASETEALSVGQALWHALFHSISAFCNAGFALHTDSLERYRFDPYVNLVICGLVMAGGLGFPVVIDLRRNWHRENWWEYWNHLLLHTRIMLLGSVILWGVGFAIILLIEWDGVLKDLVWWQRPIVSMFHSVNCRTSGFNTIPIRDFSNATLFISMLLMAIGGGPGSTAGGFKVSTAAILIVRAWSSFMGRTRVNVFRRTIPHTAVERAMATLMLFIVMGVVALTTLLIVEQDGVAHPAPPREFIDTCFEVTSALGTVGLSTGMTGYLSNVGKVVVILLMFVGRLGPISIVAALARAEHAQAYEYPAEEPLIG